MRLALAPSLTSANMARMYSARFSMKIATVSPREIPLPASTRASRLTSALNWA